MLYYLNNKYIYANPNSINISDKGFLLGDGVFTTLKAINGNLIHFNQHILRINQHAKQIYLNIKLEEDKINEICKNLLIKNNLKEKTAIIRITVTRGVGERGINISAPLIQSPTLLINAMPYQDNFNHPLNIFVTSIVRNEQSILANIKSLNYLESILARHEASLNGFDEGLMLNSKGFISCCSVANIFFLTQNDEIITPPITDGVLPGIVRQEILSICNRLKIKALEKSIELSDVKEYKAGFITNCVIGIRLIKTIQTKTINNIRFLPTNNVIPQIIEAYNKLTIFCNKIC